MDTSLLLRQKIFPRHAGIGNVQRQGRTAPPVPRSTGDWCPPSRGVPPHGAIAGLALVISSAICPCDGAMRVKYMAVPKWLEFLTLIALTPCTAARCMADCIARAAMTWPRPSPPSHTATAPYSLTTRISVTACMTPLASRFRYDESLITPCDSCPHSSACTRLSATRHASSSGTPASFSAAAAKRAKYPAAKRCRKFPLACLSRSMVRRQSGTARPVCACPYCGRDSGDLRFRRRSRPCADRERR